MSDYFFTKFYDQAKDQSWSQVNTYTEFLKLPNTIKQECFHLHNLRARLNELENEPKKYWKEFFNKCVWHPYKQNKKI